MPCVVDEVHVVDAGLPGAARAPHRELPCPCGGEQEVSRPQTACEFDPPESPRFIPEDFLLAHHPRALANHPPRTGATTRLAFRSQKLPSPGGLTSPRVLHVPQSPRLIAEECVGRNPANGDFVLVDHVPQGSIQESAAALPVIAEVQGTTNVEHGFPDLLMSFLGLRLLPNAPVAEQSGYESRARSSAVRMPKTPPPATRRAQDSPRSSSSEDEPLICSKLAGPRITRKARALDEAREACSSFDLQAQLDSDAEQGRQGEAGSKYFAEAAKHVPVPVPPFRPAKNEERRNVRRGLFERVPAEYDRDGVDRLSSAGTEASAGRTGKTIICPDLIRTPCDNACEANADEKATQEVIEFLTIAMDLKTRISPRSNRSTPFSSPLPGQSRATFSKCPSAPEVGTSSIRENSGRIILHGAARLEFGNLLNVDSPEPERPVDMKPSVYTRSAALHRNPPPPGCPFSERIDQEDASRHLSAPTSPSGPDAPDVSLPHDFTNDSFGKFTSSPASAGRATFDECYSERGDWICQGPGLPIREGESLMDTVSLWSDHGFISFRSSVLIAVLAFLAYFFLHLPSPFSPFDEPASLAADRLASEEVVSASPSHAEGKFDADLLNSLIFSLMESPSFTEEEELSVSFTTLGPTKRADLVRGEIHVVKTTADRIEGLLMTVSGSDKMAAAACSWIANLATSQILSLQQWFSRTDALLGIAFGVLFALAVQSRVSTFSSGIDFGQHAAKGKVQTSNNLGAVVEAELDERLPCK